MDFLQHNLPPLIENTSNHSSKEGETCREITHSGDDTIPLPASFSYKDELELLSLSYSKLLRRLIDLEEHVYKLGIELHNVEKFVLKQDETKTTN